VREAAGPQNTDMSMKPNDANVTRFNQQAKSWDEEPRRVAMGRAIARAVEAKLEGNARPRLMDYGCGTGLCSLPLAGRCSSVLGVDSSTEMLARLEAKARAGGFGHVTTRRHDLTAEAMIGVEFDVILCAMALHHIREIGLLLKRFDSMLAHGGLLALADLDKEDGSFHQDMRGVEHHGFDREWVRQQLRAAGFTQVSLETAYEIEKPGPSGEPRRFPVFLATARVG
jgi:2-polyprenyl-3-methyl-5-hydroxy-6-metoxy-1,4-benzoquinol methylase